MLHYKIIKDEQFTYGRDELTNWVVFSESGLIHLSGT